MFCCWVPRRRTSDCKCPTTICHLPLSSFDTFLTNSVSFFASIECNTKKTSLLSHTLNGSTVNCEISASSVQKMSWVLVGKSHGLQDGQLCTVTVWVPFMILVKVLHPTQHKIGHFGGAPQANLLAWYGKKKKTQHNKSRHSPIKRNVKQHKINKKTKARFSCLLRHPAWKWRDLFWFRRFINLSLTYLDIYPLTYSLGPTWSFNLWNFSGRLSLWMRTPTTLLEAIYSQRHDFSSWVKPRQHIKPWLL